MGCLQELSCVYVFVTGCFVPAYYSLTLSAPTVCPAKCHFLGNKDENKMLPDLTKPQGTVKYRPKVAKHAINGSFYFLIVIKYTNIKFTNLTIFF